MADRDELLTLWAVALWPSPATSPRNHLWHEEMGQDVGHGDGRLRVVWANDGHHVGHIGAVVFEDGEEVILLRQEVEPRMDVVGEVAHVHHLVAEQHARQETAAVVDLLHREAHGLHEVVAQHLQFEPAGPHCVREGQGRREGRGSHCEGGAGPQEGEGIRQTFVPLPHMGKLDKEHYRRF